METYADKTQENKTRAVPDNPTKQQSDGSSVSGLANNSAAGLQRKQMQETINNSARVKQLRENQEMANNSAGAEQLRTYQAMADNTKPARLKGTGGSPVIQRLPFDVKLKAIAWDHIRANHLPGVGKANKSVFAVSETDIDEMIFAALMMGRDKGLITVGQAGGDSFPITEEADEITGWDQDGNFTKGIRIAVKVKNDNGDCDVISAYPYKL